MMKKNFLRLKKLMLLLLLAFAGTTAMEAVTITYQGGGADGGVAPAPHYDVVWGFGSITLRNNTFTRTGYTFYKWKSSVAGREVAENGSAGPFYEDEFFTALWTANKYTVTYNYGSGTGSPASAQVTHGSAYGTLPTPTTTPVGEALDGWYTEPGGQGTKVTASTTVTGTHTLYAYYKTGNVKITFDRNGGNATEAMSDQTFTPGVAQKITECDFWRTQHAFRGWATSSSGAVVYKDKEAITIYADVTLYAVWTNSYWSISYNANGGVDDSSKEPKRVPRGESVPLRRNIFPRDNHNFTGWNTAANGTGTPYADEANITATKDMTIYAQWKIIGNDVTFDANGGSGTVPSQVLAVNGSPMPAVTVGLTKRGYDFTGFFDATTGGNKYYNANGTSSKNWDKSVNATLYAQWTPKIITVSFNGNGSTSGSQAELTVAYDSDLTALTVGYSKTGYTFNGYFDDPTSGSKYYNADGTGAKKWDIPTTPATLYAQWVANVYDVTFDPNGGVGVETAVRATYDSAMPSIVPIQAERAGYSFVGYFDTADATGGTQYYDADGASTNSWTKTSGATLYARWSTNPSYTLSFNEGGFAAKTVISGMPIGDLPEPTRTGSVFTGWEIDGTMINKNSKWTYNENKTATAKWSTGLYTLTFDPNGGAVSSTSMQVSYNTAIGTLPTPSKDKNGFDGWKIGDINITHETVWTYTTNQTAIAQWIANTSTLTLNVNGGTWVAGFTPPAVYVPGVVTALPAANNISKAGYTFEGWYDNEQLTGAPIASIPHTATGTIAYWAKWTAKTYTLTLNPVGGEVSSTTVAVTYGQAIGTLPEASKTGFAFGGWKVGETAINAATIWNFTDNQTANAQWNNLVGSITYHQENGEWADGYSAPATHTYGTVTTLPVAAEILKAGSTFGGWFNNAELTGTAVTSIPATTSGNVAYWAKWTINTYKVTFNSNGGSGMMNEQSFTYNVTESLTPNRFNKTGNTFSGWNTRADGQGTGYANEASLTLTDNLTLYAQWAPKTYTLSFNANGGSGTMSNMTFTYSEFQNLTSNGFSKENYTFEGWNTRADGNGTRYADNASITISETTELYAIWASNEHTVTFHGNGGEGTMTAQKFKHKVSAQLAANGFSKSGFRFAEWTRNQDGSGASYSNQQIVSVTEDMNLYAQWIATGSFTVRFNSMGGTLLRSVSVTAGSLLPRQSNPVKEGYAFIGWYKDINYTTAWDFATDRVNVDAELFAKWEEKSYTVAFNSNGGSAIADQMVKHNESATRPVDPLKEGYRFGGWYRNSDCTIGWEFDSKVVSNLTLYAKWIGSEYIATENRTATQATIVWEEVKDAIAYILNLYDNTGSLIGSYEVDEKGNQVVRSAVQFITFNIPCRLMSDLMYHVEVVAVSGAGEVIKNLETDIDPFEPVVTTFEVTFNSGDGSAVESDIVKVNSLAISPVNPVLADHNFKGWFKDAELTNEWNFGSDMVKGNMTLYAKWALSVGIDTPDATDLKIFSTKGEIVIKGMTQGNAYQVINMAGSTQLNNQSNGDEEIRFSVPTGIYIVKANDRAVKVVVE